MKKVTFLVVDAEMMVESQQHQIVFGESHLLMYDVAEKERTFQMVSL